MQLVPLPAAWRGGSRRRPRRSTRRDVLPAWSTPTTPRRACPRPPGIRSPATLDRSATLRWLAGAAACLGIFWAVSHFADRLGRLYLVWGSVVAAFLLNAALAVVQIGGRSEGLFGFIVPGAGPAWAPSLDDLLEAPATAALRDLAEPSRAGAAVPARPSSPRPRRSCSGP